MYIAGIVAEFDPFHSGHKYLISEARRKGADHIVAIMSGDGVQRGEIAAFSKHERAEAAIKNGADLIVELPCPFSCSCAEIFAKSAVQILVQLRINAISFGCENDNLTMLKKTADEMDKADNEPKIKELLKSGMSYPTALGKCVDDDIAEVISKPNNTLAVEYIRALNRLGYKADIMPIKRIGAGHDGTPDMGYASGSYIREKLLRSEEVGEYLPGKMSKPTDKSVIEKILFYNLITASKEKLMRTPEMNEQLANKILIEAKNPPNDYNEFLMRIKSKNITLARIRRTALMLTLGVTAEDIISPPYIRILAFNQKGTEILKNADTSLPISHSLKKLEQTSEYAKRISDTEMKAVRLYQLGMGNFENEYMRIVKPFNN